MWTALVFTMGEYWAMRSRGINPGFVSFWWWSFEYHKLESLWALRGVLLRGRCWCIPPYSRRTQRASLRTVCRITRFLTLATCKISILRLVTGVAKTHASAHAIVRRHKFLIILHIRKERMKFSSRCLTSKDVKNLYGVGMVNKKGMWDSCFNQHSQDLSKSVIPQCVTACSHSMCCNPSNLQPGLCHSGKMTEITAVQTEQEYSFRKNFASFCWIYL